MPQSISDRLRLLGVHVEPRELKSETPNHRGSLFDALGGEYRTTVYGDTYLVEKCYPLATPHGETTLEITESLENLAKWAGEPRLQSIIPNEIVFLDAESTGLSGGTGTYPFLIGVGRFNKGEFILRQFFMPDPAAENAHLAAFEAFLDSASTIVSFNGKAFDAPLITTRFTVQGLVSPIREMMHIDLLHLARRLWRDRLPSRTLGNLEVQILGKVRGELDIPGWMIPQIYFNFLRDGDPMPLQNVFYHNALDVISLAALLNHMAGLLNDPVESGGRFGVDLIALAKLFEDIGNLELASQLYVHGLEHEDAHFDRVPLDLLLQAMQRLALIRKRENSLESAMELWEQAASRQHLESHVELAKCFEHQLKDIPKALQWTEAAIELLDETPNHTNSHRLLDLYHKRRWLQSLKHRQERLRRKMERAL